MNRPKFKRHQMVRVKYLEGLDFMLGTYKVGEVFRINLIHPDHNGDIMYRKAETVFGLYERQLEEADERG